MIFNATGGTNSLNFKVVGGTTEPANPKENTIWVKTDIPITYWTTNSNSSAPAYTAKAGTVVFWWESAKSSEVSGTDSPGFMPIKYKATNPPGYMRLKPTYCYQNQDGTASGWKRINAYIYKSGSWVQFSSEFAATIAVTYPEGSTCTCTNGTITMTASNTSGSYTFTVPNTGTWTLTCTDGDQTATDTVEITADGQSESVELSYLKYLYKDGTKYVNWGAMAWGASTGGHYSSTPYISYGSTSMTISEVAEKEYRSGIVANWYIDLTDYSTLTFYGTGSTNVGYTAMYIWYNTNGTYFDSSYAARTAFSSSSPGYATLDVSSLSGKYVVGFMVYSGSSITVKQLYLSK